MCKIVQVSE